jgi:hypothetical protein
MKTLIFITLLFCSLSLGYLENKEDTIQLHERIKGRWQSEQIQIQYIVDSHLVHEQNITPERGNVYNFDGPVVRVKYPDGTTAQGTYTMVIEAEEKKVVLQLPDAITTYTLISVTPTRMVWQKDLDDVYYKEGSVQKSAERAIYTEVLKK